MTYKDSPLVSIVMCVFNGERFLKNQIESILNQTYSNFELLIINDYSSDAGNKVIEPYLKKDSRIKYFENESNTGFNQSFGKGFALCSGDLIAVSDQDDIWLPDKIRLLVNNLGESLLIYSNSELIDEFGNDLSERLDHQLNHIDNPSYKSFLDENFVTGHTCLFKKDLLKYSLPFSKTIFFYDWWLAITASYLGKVKYLDKVLTLYRIHQSSVMQKLAGHHDQKNIRSRHKHLQLIEFSKASFLKPYDKLFIIRFLEEKFESSNGLLHFISCYTFLLKNHREIYPWYKKSTIKKLNFLRKQCLK
ncbi:glycosyltransferase [Flavihumibacter sp. R14]|nr:glycosyltransferase [Flavihumibacter soli]